MDLIIGKGQKGAILTLCERSVNFLLMEEAALRQEPGEGRGGSRRGGLFRRPVRLMAEGKHRERGQAHKAVHPERDGLQGAPG